MRALVITAAALMLASTVQIDRVSLSPLQASASARTDSSELRRDLAVAAYGSEGGQDRVAGVIAAARKALGGEDKIAALKGLTAEGPFRRSMGGRDMEGVVNLTIVRPDKMRRVEELAMGGMVGGPMIERTSVLAGNTAWDDTANRGGMGGGMRIMINDGPPPAPGGGSAAGPTPEQLNEARVRRMKIQMQRLMAALLTEGPQPWVDAGVAESPDGKADILEAKEDNGRMIRLFIDQATHLPLMVQYQDPKPMIMMAGGPRPGPGAPGAPGGPPPMTPEELEKRREEMRRTPPQMGTYAMHLGDYKKVDGVMLPHKIDISLDGEPNEEWTVEKYKVNPTIKADTWEKK